MIDISDIFNFESFVLNSAQRELKQDGKLVEIEPRAFDLLIYLVENRDRAVDKGELQDAVWPGMIVTETALTRAVMNWPSACSADASQQKVIKTLHGHGYRFIAELHEKEPVVQPVVVSSEVATATQVESKTKPPPPKLNFRSLSLIAITAITIMALAWYSLRPTPSLGDEIRIAVLPLTDNTDNPELAWTRFGLMSYVSKLIANDGSMPVVPVGSTISLIESFAWNGNLEDSENNELIGKLKQVYAASHVLAMELKTESGALRMTYSLLNPDGKIQRGTIVGDAGTDLAQGVVQAIYGTMFRRSHLGGDIPLVSEDSFNNEAFARGMDLSLQGRCNEAVQFFRVIIEQEPSLFGPRYEYAACLRILGQLDGRKELRTTLIEEQRPLGASRSLAQSLLTQGILYYRTGRLDQAQQSYDEALQTSEEIADHALNARVLQNLSILYKNRSELDEAARLLDLAVLSYQNAGIETLPGHMYSGRANLNMARGEFTEAEVELELALKAFREVGDRRNEAMMLNNTGYLRRRQGRMEEAEGYHLRSLEIREEIGDRVGVGRIYSMLTGVYAGQGRYQDSKLAAESAIDIARETQDRLFEATSLAQLANAEKLLGDIDSARVHYMACRLIFVEIQDYMRTLETDLQLVRLDMQQDQLDQAASMASQILETAREYDIMSPEVQAMELLADIALLQGNTDSAIESLIEALSRVRDTTWTSKEITLERKLANAYMDIMDLESAAPLIGALGGQEARVQSLKTQARFSHLSGDADQAVEIMLRAQQLAGDKWSDTSEASLQEYRSAVSQ